ncbi:hypothetical protein [Halococcus saccharolyticus]|uniref:DUF456 domain-containing protein n=1 Tax=Halococcus saccharolyticus DSM 5350 TaxID=1227455 RepID=M0MN31_9EURY|nr:hypothetical protein [Halococcus saccharolyticus]EMA46788.1 hypothetical protein C449_03941 [Halococcus saccharolyticus DSM 5350]
MADSGGEQTKTRDVDELLADVDDITADDGDTTTGSSTDTADRVGSREHVSRGTDQGGSGLRDRAEQMFSLRTFVVALALTAVGMALGGFAPLVGGLLGFVGVFVATFVLGLVGDRSHYPETGVASAAVAGGWSVLGNVTLIAVGLGVPLIAVNAGIGLLAGLVGHYFGRDLRDGLTREI